MSIRCLDAALLSSIIHHSYCDTFGFVQVKMGLMKRFHTIVGDKPASASVDGPRTVQAAADDKEAAFPPVNEVTTNNDNSDHNQEKPSEDAQAGVKKIEAVTLAWSKSSAYLVLVL